MSIEQLVADYLRLKKELAAAVGAEGWNSCRAGHIRRLSIELGGIEEELQSAGVRDDVFAALIAGEPEPTNGCFHQDPPPFELKRHSAAGAVRHLSS